MKLKSGFFRLAPKSMFFLFYTVVTQVERICNFPSMGLVNCVSKKEYGYDTVQKKLERNLRDGNMLGVWTDPTA